MPGKIEGYHDKAGAFRFRRKAGNFAFYLLTENKQVVGASQQNKKIVSKDIGIQSVIITN